MLFRPCDIFSSSAFLPFSPVNRKARENSNDLGNVERSPVRLIPLTLEGWTDLIIYKRRCTPTMKTCNVINYNTIYRKIFDLGIYCMRLDEKRMLGYFSISLLHFQRILTWAELEKSNFLTSWNGWFFYVLIKSNSVDISSQPKKVGLCILIRINLLGCFSTAKYCQLLSELASNNLDYSNGAVIFPSSYQRFDLNI